MLEKSTLAANLPRPTSAWRQRLRAVSVLVACSSGPLQAGSPWVVSLPWRLIAISIFRTAGGWVPSVVPIAPRTLIVTGARRSRGSECGLKPLVKEIRRFPSCASSARASAGAEQADEGEQGGYERGVDASAPSSLGAGFCG